MAILVGVPDTDGLRGAPYRRVHLIAHRQLLHRGLLPQGRGISPPARRAAHVPCAPHASPTQRSAKTISRARWPSCRRRPSLPKCPAWNSVRNRNGPPHVLSRKRRTHFAGSQYVTRGSASPALASTAG